MSITPSLTPSMTWNAPTTAPAGRRSIFSRPPDIASTRSTYCCAIVCQMSDAGQLVCIFSTIGDCARTAGAATSVLAAAPPAITLPRRRNERRDTALPVSFFIVIIVSSPFGPGLSSCPSRDRVTKSAIQKAGLARP